MVLHAELGVGLRKEGTGWLVLYKCISVTRQWNILGISNLYCLDCWIFQIKWIQFLITLHRGSFPIFLFKELQCGDNIVHLQCCRYKGIFQVIFPFFMERNNGDRRASRENMLPIYNSISCNLKFGKILENLDERIKALASFFFFSSFCAVVNLKLWTVRQWYVPEVCHGSLQTRISLDFSKDSTLPSKIRRICLASSLCL